MVERGEFRQDLYYRLSAFPVRIPSLRERPDDIAALAEHFLSSNDDGDRFVPLAPEVIETLMTYDYPGNVRELRNIVERAAILAYGEDIIRPEHLVFEGPRRQEVQQAGGERGLLEGGSRKLLQRRNGRLTDDEVMHALETCDGHRARAAQRLGVSERTLYRYVERMRGN
jgi:transcriptional regulator with PAS, ATPase and Fis domain